MKFAHPSNRNRTPSPPLRGRPDKPPAEPDKPPAAETPDPSWSKTQDGSKLWRVIEDSDADFAMPGEPGLVKR